MRDEEDYIDAEPFEILREDLGEFFSDEFDEYTVEEMRAKIENDTAFMGRLKAEMLDILSRYKTETFEIDMRD